MDDQALLEYLRDYVADPRIVSVPSLSDAEAGLLPEWWLDALSREGTTRVEAVLARWRGFAEELEQVVEYLRANLETIHLIHHEAGYCLLYGVRSTAGEVLYYEGRNPKTKVTSPAVLEIWDALPAALRRLYDELHNGWYFFGSRSMGPAPVEDFFFLEEQDWGILDEIGEPPVDLAQTLALYTNGAGGWVCLEVKPSALGALIWWSSEAPTLDVELWPVVDAWTTMGFEE